MICFDDFDFVCWYKLKISILCYSAVLFEMIRRTWAPRQKWRFLNFEIYLFVLVFLLYLHMIQLFWSGPCNSLWSWWFFLCRITILIHERVWNLDTNELIESYCFISTSAECYLNSVWPCVLSWYLSKKTYSFPPVVCVSVSCAHVKQWASYQIHKIADCACARNAGNVFPATTGKRSRHASRHVRDAGVVMNAGIAIPKSVAGKTFPAFPVHAQSAISRIW